MVNAADLAPGLDPSIWQQVDPEALGRDPLPVVAVGGQRLSLCRFRVDPDSGAHTNTIKSTWRALKQSLPLGNGTYKTLYDSYFSQYCVRKAFLVDSPDPLLKNFELIRDV